jgi:hypothetical protein
MSGLSFSWKRARVTLNGLPSIVDIESLMQNSCVGETEPGRSALGEMEFDMIVALGCAEED